jgi:hypothetical protein
MKTINGTARHRSQPPSVTGRDGYIEAQALAYAIMAIELRPERYQEWSNKEDMKTILDHLCTDGRIKRHLLDNARAHLTGIGHPLGPTIQSDTHAA